MRKSESQLMRDSFLSSLKNINNIHQYFHSSSMNDRVLDLINIIKNQQQLIPHINQFIHIFPLNKGNIRVDGDARLRLFTVRTERLEYFLVFYLHSPVFRPMNNPNDE